MACNLLCACFRLATLPHSSHISDTDSSTLKHYAELQCGNTMAFWRGDGDHDVWSLNFTWKRRIILFSWTILCWFENVLVNIKSTGMPWNDFLLLIFELKEKGCRVNCAVFFWMMMKKHKFLSEYCLFHGPLLTLLSAVYVQRSAAVSPPAVFHLKWSFYASAASYRLLPWPVYCLSLIHNTNTITM